MTFLSAFLVLVVFALASTVLLWIINFKNIRNNKRIMKGLIIFSFLPYLNSLLMIVGIIALVYVPM